MGNRIRAIRTAGTIQGPGHGVISTRVAGDAILQGRVEECSRWTRNTRPHGIRLKMQHRQYVAQIAAYFRVTTRLVSTIWATCEYGSA